MAVRERIRAARAALSTTRPEGKLGRTPRRLRQYARRLPLRQGAHRTQKKFTAQQVARKIINHHRDGFTNLTVRGFASLETAIVKALAASAMTERERIVKWLTDLAVVGGSLTATEAGVLAECIERGDHLNLPDKERT